MDFVKADSDYLESNSSNPSKRVRVVGRIRGFTDRESQALGQDSKNWIAVQKHLKNGSLDKVTVSVKTDSNSHKNLYEMDSCYESDEHTELLYSREVTTMITEVFDGRNASIVALGARGSGKSFTIRGSVEKPGLAVMAMSEILLRANESKKTVSISFYQVSQDHAYDLLDPNYSEFQVMDTVQGKIYCKGLSKATVNSMEEFCQIYFKQLNCHKTDKSSNDQQRCHKGLIVHISSHDDKLMTKMENKINFVDLAGYEDIRKNNIEGATLAETKRTNKSLFAILNVISALNANETHVPYRESKLTRILKDSLGGSSRVLLLTCLNPFFCKDSISSLCFVSRSLQTTKQILTDSTNRNRNSAKSKVFSSVESRKPTSSLNSKRKNIYGQNPSGKKGSSILKGRKLMDAENSNNSKQLICMPEDNSSLKPELLDDHTLAVMPFSLEEETTELVEKDTPLHDTEALDITTPGNNPCEQQNSNEDRSIPLSQRIKEISDNLKLLCSSTPLRVKMNEEVVPYNSTPGKKFDGAVCPSSPKDAIKINGSDFKNSLVKDQLKFLNSASKDELKRLKGIGERRATYILELREESPQPFKSLDDLQDIGMSAKQIKQMMKGVAAEMFN